MHRTDPREVGTTATGPRAGAETADAGVPLEQRKLDEFRTALLAKTPFAIFTPLILLANLAVFGVMVAQGISPLAPTADQLIEWGANFAPKTFDGEEWRLFTYMFLHFGLVHLGMNMLALWSLGLFSERLFGNLGFGLLYLFSGLAGGIASASDNALAVSAGASGAIFGIAGALLGGCFKLYKSMPKPYLRAAWWLGVNILVLVVIFSIVNRFQPMIDNTAHLVGFGVGVLCGLILAEPVPHPKKSRTWLRNLAVAGLGTAGLFAAFEMRPAAPADVDALWTRFQSVEKRCLRRLETLDGRYRQGAISEEEYADGLATEVLADWRELRQTFEEAENIPPEFQERKAKFDKILALRQAGWEAEIEAIKNDQPQKHLEARRLLNEASRLIQELNEDAEAR